jgi:hypothetical protein
MVHVEPGPFTVTVPKPGTPLVLSPIELSNTDALLTTLPPFSMVSVPVPARPTLREELMVQMVEPGGAPAPFTVTAPEEPALSPISAPLWRIGVARVVVTVAPFEMMRMPVPNPPTVKFWAVLNWAPGPFTVTVPVPVAVWPIQLPATATQLCVAPVTLRTAPSISTLPVPVLPTARNGAVTVTGEFTVTGDDKFGKPIICGVDVKLLKLPVNVML